MQKREKGFSLIELLIVVAIILIIAAIAIPNLLRSRIAANQASAVGTLRTITTANLNFNSSYGVGFANSLAQLGGPAGGAASCVQAEMIDSTLSVGANPQKSGYTLTYFPGANNYGAGAAPAACGAWGKTTFSVDNVATNLGQTGQTAYCVDDSGAIRFDPTGAAPTNPCDTSGLLALQ